MTARGEGDNVYRDPGLSPATAGCGLSVRDPWGSANAPPQALCCRPLPRASLDFGATRLFVQSRDRDTQVEHFGRSLPLSVLIGVCLNTCIPLLQLTMIESLFA